VYTGSSCGRKGTFAAWPACTVQVGHGDGDGDDLEPEILYYSAQLFEDLQQWVPVKREGNQLLTLCKKLKLMASDGKRLGYDPVTENPLLPATHERRANDGAAARTVHTR
jgi:hypothetical protein